MSESTIKIDIEVNDAPVKSLKTQLRETIDQMGLVGSSSEEFDKLTARAAAFQDKINEVNEQVAVFSTGSNYEIVSNSLGEIGAGLADMDFDRVTQGAKLFKTAAAGITFKGAIGSLKQMGSAFISIGKTILTNPLFLIVAVVVAIGAAIYKLLDTLGVLDVIFKAVGDAIGFVIQKLKEFLDWIGLTDFAAEDSARKQAEGQERIVAAHEKKKERVSDAYDHEIRMAKIAGKNTVDLEREKQHAIIETSNAQIDSLRVQMSALKASGDLTKEKAQEIRDAIGELKTGIREAKQEIQAINATEIAEEKKKTVAVQKVRRTGAGNAKKDRETEAKNRLNAQRAIQDAGLELMAEGEEKELLANRRKYERLIEDTKTNEALLAAEKLSLISAFAEQEFQTRNNIQKKYVDEMTAAIDVANNTRGKSDKFLVDSQLENMTNIKAKNEENAKAAMELDQAIFAGKLEAGSQILGALQANLKEGGKASKAVAVAQAVMDTYKGANAIFASAAINPSTVLFPAQPFIAAAAAVGMGIANVRKILTVDSSGTSNPSAPSPSSVQMPSFGMAQTPQTPQMNFNNGVNQSAGGSSMSQKVMVVDYFDISNKGKELNNLQNKVTLA